MTAAYSIAAPAGVATKVCSKCGECKPATAEFFAKAKKGKFGLRSICKACLSAYYAKNKEHLDACNRQNYAAKRDDICAANRARYASDVEFRAKALESNKRWREENKPEIAQKRRARYSENREAVLAYMRRYRQENAEKIRARKVAYRGKYLNAIREMDRRYYASNSARIKQSIQRYVRERRRVDNIFAMKLRVRNLLAFALKRIGERKKHRTSHVLGCTFEEFAQHIERQFLKCMSWENRSEWHIDHIIPLATAKTEEDVIRLNHYTNLRPLWAKDNLRKGARIDYII